MQLSSLPEAAHVSAMCGLDPTMRKDAVDMTCAQEWNTKVPSVQAQASWIRSLVDPLSPLFAAVLFDQLLVYCQVCCQIVIALTSGPSRLCTRICFRILRAQCVCSRGSKAKRLSAIA